MIRARAPSAAAAALIATGLCACSPSPAPAPRDTGKAAAAAPYATSLPLKEFMGHVMQYAGDGIWKRQGSISGPDGERSLFPKDAAGWEEAESASLALSEVANVLLIPGRRVEEPQWDAAVARVQSVAREAAAAAERRDEQAFFRAGGELDEACESCHLRYMPGVRRP